MSLFKNLHGLDQLFEKNSYIQDGPYRVVLYKDEYAIAVKREGHWHILVTDIIQCDDDGEAWWFRDTTGIPKRYVEALEDALNVRLNTLLN